MKFRQYNENFRLFIFNFWVGRTGSKGRRPIFEILAAFNSQRARSKSGRPIVASAAALRFVIWMVGCLLPLLRPPKPFTFSCRVLPSRVPSCHGEDEAHRKKRPPSEAAPVHRVYQYPAESSRFSSSPFFLSFRWLRLPSHISLHLRLLLITKATAAATPSRTAPVCSPDFSFVLFVFLFFLAFLSLTRFLDFAPTEWHESQPGGCASRFSLFLRPCV